MQQKNYFFSAFSFGLLWLLSFFFHQIKTFLAHDVHHNEQRCQIVRKKKSFHFFFLFWVVVKQWMNTGKQRTPEISDHLPHRSWNRLKSTLRVRHFPDNPKKSSHRLQLLFLTKQKRWTNKKNFRTKKKSPFYH